MDYNTSTGNMSLLPGTICIANGSHESSASNELCYEKGDVITLISDLTRDGQHYQAAAADGSIGLFPVFSVLRRPSTPLHPMPWFHGAISRLEAEKLVDRNQDGQFLFRTSQNTKGIYAMALSYHGVVSHYLVAIDFRTRKLTLNGEKYFDNLLSLKEYYSTHSDGIATPLKHPVIRRGTLEFHIDSEHLKSDWGLPDSDVEVRNEVIGYGEFGEVHTGMYRQAQVAVKSIHESKQSSVAVASFLREAAIMTHLRHRNLVQMVGVVFNNSALKSIVLELMGKGSLQKYLISRGRTVVTQLELLSFARDVCSGMLYISSKGYVHRDLAARNVLLNSNGQAKISDFGLTRKSDIFVPNEGGKFPVKWTAPEALKESKFSTMSDVWSFGVLLWEIYSYGRTPYPSVPSDEVLEILEDGELMDPPDNCPEGIYDIMCKCWEMEPSNRPSFRSLEQNLQNSFGESKTASNGHIPAKKPISVSTSEVESLVMSPVATKAYREAPFTRKATMLLAGIIFLGPLNSGKTSLLRSFLDQQFRLMEPATQNISFSDAYHELADSKEWQLSTAGLMYEDELVRIIVDDLLKHTQSVALSAATNSGDTPPPLPKRSRSFSDREGLLDALQSTSLDVDAIKASHRFSASIEVMESGSLEGQLQLGYHPQSVVATGSPQLRRRTEGHKRSFFNRLSKRFHVRTTSGKGDSVRRHYSDSVKRVNYAATNGTTENGSSEYYSPLPERLIEKITYELHECSSGTLTPKYFGRLVDTPGNPCFSVVRHLFVTEQSVCVLVYDASRDMHSPALSPLMQRKSPLGHKDAQHNGTSSPTPSSGDKTYLGAIMSDLANLCLHWSQSNADLAIRGPRVILVGTHSDKTTSSVTSQNFETLRDAVKSSPYAKFVATTKFIVSSSSIIERSNIDDLKHFVMETVKKVSRQQVPLRWLRCVRRFTGLLRNGTHFLSLADARQLISELCDLTQPQDVQDVLHFLRENHVIVHLHRIHQLKKIVVTNPPWFAHQISVVFAAATMEFKGPHPPELVSDQHLLRSTGILSGKLLDYIWRDKEVRSHKEQLLIMMYKMDLLCCLGPDSKPLVLSADIEYFTQTTSSKKKHPPKFLVSSLVVPSLAEEVIPSHLSSLTSYEVDVLYFRFKDGFIPCGLFHRVVVRCVASYPSNFSIYRNAALFEVDSNTLLALTTGRDYIKLSLHQFRLEPTDFVLATLLSTDLDDLSTEKAMPNPDTCMAILMFIQATISDLVQQWLPHLSYDLCVSCRCSGSREAHHLVLSDVDDVLQQPVLTCEAGSQVPTLPSLTCWFGEITPPRKISTSSEQDFVTEEDLAIVSENLSNFWKELGQILGFSQAELERFSRAAASTPDVSPSTVCQTAGKLMLQEWQTVHSQNATLFALLGALEIVQRKDIADTLLAARMSGEGLDI